MEEINLKLNEDEAIVLFEFLSRFSEDGKLKIEDESEEKILWDLCWDLEKALTDPFQKNYDGLLLSARKNVRNKG